MTENQELLVLSPTNKLDRVYCFKNFNGKKAMVVHPDTWKNMKTSDITGYNLNKAEVVFFLRKIGEQRWGILKQLPGYQGRDLEFKKSLLGGLEVTFLSHSMLSSGATNGFLINDAEISFTMCWALVFRISAVVLYKDENSMRWLSGKDQPFLASTLATSMHDNMITSNTTQLLPDAYFSYTNVVFGRPGSCGINSFAGLDGVMLGGSIGFFLN